MQMKHSWKQTGAQSRPISELYLLPPSWWHPQLTPLLSHIAFLKQTLGVWLHPPQQLQNEPMDVDQVRPRSGHPVVCHCCYRTGHYPLQCPQAYDIWTMTTEKLEILLELMALVDGSDIQHTESKHEIEGGLEPEKETKEDFGSSSGWDVYPHCMYIIYSPVLRLTLRHQLLQSHPKSHRVLHRFGKSTALTSVMTQTLLIISKLYAFWSHTKIPRYPHYQFVSNYTLHLISL